MLEACHLLYDVRQLAWRSLLPRSEQPSAIFISHRFALLYAGAETKKQKEDLTWATSDGRSRSHVVASIILYSVFSGQLGYDRSAILLVDHICGGEQKRDRARSRRTYRARDSALNRERSQGDPKLNLSTPTPLKQQRTIEAEHPICRSGPLRRWRNPC